MKDGGVEFSLNVEMVEAGRDVRTTIMIRNIPNKYSNKMLLATVDETHKRTYDFFYLPIDLKVARPPPPPGDANRTNATSAMLSSTSSSPSASSPSTAPSTTADGTNLTARRSAS
jgi:hypothetical protein